MKTSSQVRDDESEKAERLQDRVVRQQSFPNHPNFRPNRSIRCLEVLCRREKIAREKHKGSTRGGKKTAHISGYSGKDTSLECTSESYLFRRRTWFPLASSTCCTSCAGSLTEQTGHRRTRKAAGEWGEGNRKGEGRRRQ